MAGPLFYNQGDQNIYKDFQFVPQEKYRTGFTAPVQGGGQDASTSSFGIPNTNAFTNSGGGDGGGGGNNINNTGNLGNYKNIDFNERYTYNPQEFMADANDYGYGVADQDKGFFKETMNKIGTTFRGSPVDKALGKGMDFGKTIGSGIISAASGVPFLGNALNYATRNMEDRTLGAGIIDEQGNFFDEEELNKQNALGGYYTDAARSARRRTKRIANMIARRKAKKNFSKKNLDKLQEQEKAQEGARQAAANKMQSENRQNETGGYQAGYGSDFMEGGKDDRGNERGRGNDPDDKGGSDTMGSFAKGGRVGYFFGGRVNYKVGGRTDAGPNRTTASHSTRGQINESGQQVSGGQNTRDNNGGNDSPTFYSPPNKTETLYENTILGNVPAGLTRNMNIGRLSAMLNLNKLKDEELEGKMQFDSSIGPINTTTTYDSVNGPEFNASYNNNNLNANFNTTTGLGVNYSKDIGPGTFTVGGDIDPYGNYNTEAKYGISFANGGLASIL